MNFLYRVWWLKCDSDWSSFNKIEECSRQLNDNFLARLTLNFKLLRLRKVIFSSDWNQISKFTTKTFFKFVYIWTDVVPPA